MQRAAILLAATRGRTPAGVAIDYRQQQRMRHEAHDRHRKLVAKTGDDDAAAAHEGPAQELKAKPEILQRYLGV